MKQDRQKVRAAFREALVCGMRGEKSSLKCLPSFLPPPNGTECGEWMALDFGGTNLRAMTVRLAGGKADILRMKKVSLRKAGAYDLTDGSTTAEELFDAIAHLIADVAPERGDVLLGHTFSFPARQISIDKAELITWTKEFAVQGVVGREVNGLLADALSRCGASRIRPAAIVNDTVGTLLCCAYREPSATIGSICGTGHNTAAVLPDGMLYNLESGNFDGIDMTEYDEEIDRTSLIPSAQRLEKMCAGHYLGKLVTLAASEDLAMLRTGAQLTGEDLSAILADGGESVRTADLIEARFGTRPERGACAALRRVTRAVSSRSAQLVALTYLGILDVIDPNHERHHTIAVDGSLFGKMPSYADTMKRVLTEGLAGTNSTVSLVHAGDGSGIGAAVAASLAEKARI